MVWAPPEKFDPYVASAILLIALVGGIADVMLFSYCGEQYTISAYLRRVMRQYPAILAIVSFSAGALFAHILLSEK